MIKIRSIRILDSSFKALVIKYPDDLRFTSSDLVEKFINNEREKWTNVFEQDVTIDIDYMEIPQSVNVLSICTHTAEEMGITLKALFGKTKQTDVVRAKMYAVNIMLDSGIPVSHIEEQTPFKNRIYYYYQNTLSGLIDTDPKVDAEYKDVFDKVMTKIKDNE